MGDHTLDVSLKLTQKSRAEALPRFSIVTVKVTVSPTDGFSGLQLTDRTLRSATRVASYANVSEPLFVSSVSTTRSPWST